MNARFACFAAAAVILFSACGKKAPTRDAASDTTSATPLRQEPEKTGPSPNDKFSDATVLKPGDLNATLEPMGPTDSSTRVDGNPVVLSPSAQPTATPTPFSSPPIVGSTHALPAKVTYRDTNGDGNADIGWRHGTSGEMQLWHMGGITVLANPAPQSSVAGTTLIHKDLNWIRTAFGDFDGDGRQDTLWRNSVTGENKIWLFNGNKVTQEDIPPVADLNWQAVGSGDFNADGKADIFWKHASGQTAVWAMNGKAVVSMTNSGVAGTYNFQGSGDFNGDGKSDVLWRHPTTGDVQVWTHDGATVTAAGSPGVVADLSWDIRGVADFNKDGKADIVWRHGTGVNVIWAMNGLVKLGDLPLPAVSDPTWILHGLGDFNGDKSFDFLWRQQTSGLIGVWLMNGNAFLSRGGTSPTAP